MIARWPQSSSLICGCRVALKPEGPGDIVLYFPCQANCPTVDLAKTECEKAGKTWEERHASRN